MEDGWSLAGLSDDLPALLDLRLVLAALQADSIDHLFELRAVHGGRQLLISGTAAKSSPSFGGVNIAGRV